MARLSGEQANGMTYEGGSVEYPEYPWHPTGRRCPNVIIAANGEM